MRGEPNTPGRRARRRLARVAAEGLLLAWWLSIMWLLPVNLLHPILSPHLGNGMANIVLGVALLSVLMGVVPTWAAWRWRRLRDAEPAWPYCRACGYDLTGSARAGRESCPECGEAFAAPEHHAPSHRGVR